VGFSPARSENATGLLLRNDAAATGYDEKHGQTGRELVTGAILQHQIFPSIGIRNIKS
jgi:hypothetical protein